ncbi:MULTISPECIES: ATP-binding protein [Pseudomonas]|uniref:histidine kinase n=1 Tax=Pseudomonas segetis TaxID=298908 RepID=A0A239BXG7_9PSED|nr:MULTISPECIES: ATP-binding protein [Pseudomonas]SNS12108.1 two-component system, OmpR family, sensor histidine kinase RstB [Pseudomonas segetis]
MNSIFLRIYVGMLAVLVLVGLLGVGTLHLVNEVRSDQYREDLARGTFNLMADNLQPMIDVERRRAIATWSRLLGIPLQIVSVADSGLDSTSRSRLLRGQVVVKLIGPHAVQVSTLISESQQLLLVGEVRQISEQLARATIFLLIDELVRFPVDEQPQRLADIKQSKQFGFDLRLIRIEDANLDVDQRRRIDESDTVMALGKGGDTIHVYSGIVDTPWVLEIGPLYQMNPYPPQLLVLIAMLGLSLIGVTVYFLVRPLERRLRGLEGAASLIASGKLDARVAAHGADSVGRLASAFNDMAEHLQRSLGIQREMVRAVSHELRTPLARLRFGLEMVEDASNEQDRQRYLEGMDSDIHDLDKLVDEMLTYARLEQGAPAINFQPVNLQLLIEQVADELAPLRAEVQIECGPSSAAVDAGAALVEAEPRYLHRALQNLVSNALRHAETRVRISYQIDDERCCLSVEDDGPGVPEDEWERIFTPFLRLDDSRTRSSGGHGLGLSIVRRIIYWHAGRSQLGHSEALGGAHFSLVWPRRQA